MSDSVINIATHPVDLSDGRTLAPGEDATDVAMNSHNKALVDAGSLRVVSSGSKTKADKPKQEGDR